MRFTQLATLGVALLSGLGGCATKPNSGMTSQYLNPEPGVFYRYGNFCGPGVPFPEGQRTAENAKRIFDVQPVDTLDAACKVHDLCYVRYGSNNSDCDQVFIQAMLGELKPLGDPLMYQCQRLRSEIYYSLYFKKRGNVEESVSFGLGTIITAPLAAMEVGYGATVNNRGFPEAPGFCNFLWPWTTHFDLAIERLNNLEEDCMFDTDYSNARQTSQGLVVKLIPRTAEERKLCATTQGTATPFTDFADFIMTGEQVKAMRAAEARK